MEVPLERSRWIAAAADCVNGALAHTSPVYVVVEGQPTWCPERGPALIEKQLAAMRGIEKEFSGKDDPRSRGILERLRKAARTYAILKAAMEKAR